VSADAQVHLPIFPLPDLTFFPHQVVSAVIPSPALRQRLLEEVDVEPRLRRLLRVLDAFLAGLSGER